MASKRRASGEIDAPHRQNGETNRGVGAVIAPERGQIAAPTTKKKGPAPGGASPESLGEDA